MLLPLYIGNQYYYQSSDLSTGLVSLPVLTEKQVVQDGGQPSCRSASELAGGKIKSSQPLFPLAAVGGKTSKTGTLTSPDLSIGNVDNREA